MTWLQTLGQEALRDERVSSEMRSFRRTKKNLIEFGSLGSDSVLVSIDCLLQTPYSTRQVIDEVQ